MTVFPASASRLLIFLMVLSVSPLSSQVNWLDATEVAPFGFGNKRPRIVTGSDAKPMLVWTNTANVMFARWTGDKFTDPVQLNPDSVSIAEANWMGVDIAAHGDSIYVVYKQTPEDLPDSHIWCIASHDGGVSFEAPVAVDQLTDARSRFPIVTTDPFGNPVVGFMKFNLSFREARWVVTRSTDGGKTFTPDVLAGNWSDPFAEACDCCPGSIASSGEHVAVLYRDNDNDNRDNWAGISADSGKTFVGGMNIDQRNWIIPACPSSGPDGVIISDTLYSVSMNGANGIRIYFNANSIDSIKGSQGIRLVDDFSGLQQQNFPRISNSDKKAAVVWRQIANSKVSVPIAWTEDITSGFEVTAEPLVEGAIENPDVAVTADSIYVVWQDNATGKVMFRRGGFSSTSSSEAIRIPEYQLYPNPSSSEWILNSEIPGGTTIEILDNNGRIVDEFNIRTRSNAVEIPNTELPPGIYYIRINSDHGRSTLTAIKQ